MIVSLATRAIRKPGSGVTAWLAGRTMKFFLVFPRDHPLRSPPRSLPWFRPASVAIPGGAGFVRGHMRSPSRRFRPVRPGGRRFGANVASRDVDDGDRAWRDPSTFRASQVPSARTPPSLAASFPKDTTPTALTPIFVGKWGGGRQKLIPANAQTHGNCGRVGVRKCGVGKERPHGRRG